MTTNKEPKFHALHYNFVAKRIRENYPKPLDYSSKGEYLSVAAKVQDIALNFAKKFYEDSNQFDPLKFLEQCSPDPELIPLSELWEEHDGS